MEAEGMAGSRWGLKNGQVPLKGIGQGYMLWTIGHRAGLTTCMDCILAEAWGERLRPNPYLLRRHSCEATRMAS